MEIYLKPIGYIRFDEQRAKAHNNTWVEGETSPQWGRAIGQYSFTESEMRELNFHCIIYDAKNMNYAKNRPSAMLWKERRLGNFV